MPRTKDERLLTAAPPFEPPGEPEEEIEGPESPDHDVTDAAAVKRPEKEKQRMNQ